MKRLLLPILCALPMLLAGCSGLGNKAASLSMVYGVVALLSLLILIAYIVLIRQKEKWFYFLFSSVMIINVGYFCLSVSQTLPQALMANRIAYLGSVFLPPSMLIIILRTLKIDCRKWAVILMGSICVVMFAITASPGLLPIYYKEVELVIVDGVAVLDKVYGPLHPLYLLYLLGYFATMVGAIIYAYKKNCFASCVPAVILTLAVFSNIGVWLLEQLVKIDFEFLSVSYIITELFLVGLALLLQQKPEAPIEPPPPTPTEDLQQAHRYLCEQLSTLTPAEKNIYELYLAGCSAKEVIAKLYITENTLKYHNRNIYSKLGVSNRKQLLAVAKYKKQ